jgi:hypothetical protein
VDEVDPYQYGYESGFATGRSEGRSEGFTEGRSQGYQDGLANGHVEARRNILVAVHQQRETLMREQVANIELGPSRRRYIRNAISVLTDIIQYLSPTETDLQ